VIRDLISYLPPAQDYTTNGQDSSWVAKFGNLEIFEFFNSFQCSFISHHLPTLLERLTDEKRGLRLRQTWQKPGYNLKPEPEKLNTKEQSMPSELSPVKKESKLSSKAPSSE